MTDTAVNSGSTIQVRLTTRTETPIPSVPIVIPTNVARYGLSQILNHLLENEAPIPYSFLINSIYLSSTLDEYITSHGVSQEEVLEIEYVRSVLPPKWEGRWSQEDWISGVSLMDSRAVTGGYDGLVRVWDWSGNVVGKARSEDSALRPVKCVRWIDEEGFVSGGMDGSLRIWGVEGDRVELRMEGKGHKASVDMIDVKDGKILSASADGSLKLWSLDLEGNDNEEAVSQKRKKRRTQKTHPTKSCLSTFTPSQGHPLTATIFHNTDSSIAYTTSLSSHLHTHDLLTSSSTPIHSTPFPSPLLTLLSLPSVFQLALGTTSNTIHLHDPRSPTISTSVLRGHEGFVVSLAPSPESPHMFASGSFDGYVRVWDVRHPQGSVFKLSRQQDAGKILAVDWNGKGLVAGGQDGKLDIWSGNGSSMAKL